MLRHSTLPSPAHVSSRESVGVLNSSILTLRFPTTWKMDQLRFAAIRIMIPTGLRIGEAARVLPEFEVSALVSTTEIYTRRTGNAFWLEVGEEQKRHWIQKCRQNYVPACFDELQAMQEKLHARHGGTMSATARMYVGRMAKSDGGGDWRSLGSPKRQRHRRLHRS